MSEYEGEPGVPHTPILVDELIAPYRGEEEEEE